MITPQEVADLQVGDVVELSDDRWQGSVMRGPLVEWKGNLILGISGVSSREAGRRYIVRRYGGGVSEQSRTRYLTVIKRAKRPFYVNAPGRTDPYVGDVVRGADDMEDTWVWVYQPDLRYFGPSAPNWVVLKNGSRRRRSDLPARLRLLVSGLSGQVVS